MGGNYLFVWLGFLTCTLNLASHFQFPLVQYHMVCRDGFVSSRPSVSNTLLLSGGNVWRILVGFFWYDLISFLVCAWDPVSRLAFPLVLHQVFVCSFRFWAGELPENSWWKVQAAPRFDSSRRNSENSYKDCVFARLRPWKSTGVLRCAQCLRQYGL